MPKVPSFFEQVAEKVPNIRVFPPWLSGMPIAPTEEARTDDPVAPWISVDFDPVTADLVIPIEVPLGTRADLADIPDLGALIDEQLVAEFLSSPPTADMLAAYLPWHFYGPSFGIYVFARNTLAFIGSMASRIGVTPNRFGRHGLRQLIVHEQAHFLFEIAATELEDVVGQSLYAEYCFHRTQPSPPFTDGPAEEIAACWRELTYARGQVGDDPDLARYPQVMEGDLMALPAGYSDYFYMKEEPERVRSAIASQIAGSACPGGLVTGRWGTPIGREGDSAPIYWVGDASALVALHAFPRTVSPPPIRRFEVWLRKIGAEQISGGKGSHRRIKLPNGCKAGYATSAGILLRPEAKQIAHALGLGGARALYECVHEMRVPA